MKQKITKTDRKIVITGGSSDLSSILESVRIRIEKTTEDIESELGKFSNQEEWDEYMKTQHMFEVKGDIKIDQDIPKDVIIESLK